MQWLVAASVAGSGGVTIDLSFIISGTVERRRHLEAQQYIDTYSVFHVILLQDRGCFEFVLRLLVSPKASMWHQDWAQISFRSETH